MWRQVNEKPQVKVKILYMCLNTSNYLFSTSSHFFSNSSFVFVFVFFPNSFSFHYYSFKLSRMLLNATELQRGKPDTSERNQTHHRLLC